MNQKTVSIELQPVKVVVNPKKGSSDKEILKLAEAQFIAQLKEHFPFYKYQLLDATSMSLEECEVGRIVRCKGELGYIFEIKPTRKFPVSLILSGARRIKAIPEALEAVEEESLLGTVWNERPDFMKEMGEWSPGHNAYIPFDKEIRKVIVEKVTKTQIIVYQLRTEVTKKYTPLKASQFALLCDTEEQAIKFIK